MLSWRDVASFPGESGAGVGAERLKVTLVSRIYLPEAAAAAFRLGSMVRRLTEDGADVLVLTSKTPGNAAGGDALPGKVRRWPVLRDRRGQVRGYLQYLSFDLPVFFRLLFSRKADVVVVEPPPTTGFSVRIACAIRSIPFVYYAADIWSDASASTGAPRIVVSILRRIEAGVLGVAAKVLAVNQSLAARVRQLSPNSTVEVVGNGVDTSVFTAIGEVTGDAAFAVYAGTTSEWQGVDIFLRALHQYRGPGQRPRLVFLGQGTAWQGLKELATGLNLLNRVDFVGQVPPEEAAGWIRGARVALVSMKPGQGYDFALPTKVLAALASGTPVLYAGVGPASDLIDSAPPGVFAGWAVPYSPSAVVTALSEVFERRPPSPEQRKRLSEWAKREVSLDAVSARVSATLEEFGSVSGRL